MKTVMMLILIFLGMMGFLFFDIYQREKETSYQGVIMSKGYEEPTSGYKSRRGPTYFIIMRETRVNKAIRVNVNIPTYYSLNEGDTAYFTISNNNMSRYGNIQDARKNLYGE